MTDQNAGPHPAANDGAQAQQTNNGGADAADKTKDNGQQQTIVAAADKGGNEGQQQEGQQQQAAPDWRVSMAGEDRDALKRLERFTDPAAFFKSYRSLEAKLSGGEYKKALPENATPEEVATWRKENGLPEKPEGYLEKLQLPNGVVLGEADKPVAESFAKLAHEKNWTQGQVNDAIAWHYANLDAQRIAQDDADAVFKQEAEDALRSEWQGADYRRNLTAVNNLIATWPGDLAANVLSARTPDGKKLGDLPGFIKQLASLSRELNPMATLVPAGSADPAKAASDRIADLKKMMADRNSDYWRGPKAEQYQQEYRDLLTAQEKVSARAA